MPDTSVAVSIKGRQLGDGEVQSLVEVQVEEASDAADAAVIVAGIDAGLDGEWSSVLDALTQPRTPLVVELSRGGTTYRFEGVSAEAQWAMSPGGASRLTVKALDLSLLLDADEVVVAWPGSSDSGIAASIFSSHGLGANVKDTPAGPDPDTHVVIQRGTDWAFIRSLAAKWGYVAYLEYESGRVVGHFHPLQPLASPQAELELGFGKDSPDLKVEGQLSAGQKVTATRVPPLSDSPATAVGAGTDEPQGSRSLGGQVGLLLSPSDVDGEVDPGSVADGMARQSAFGLTVTTTINADTAGIMLRARRNVLVRGLGSSLSGVWLVRRVRHRVSPDGHLMDVTLVRNALGLSGSEDFGSMARRP